MKRTPVTQEDELGCGVACTAFVLEQSYQKAKTYFDKKKVESYGCDCPDIVKVLRANGMKYKWGKYQGQKIPDGAIVFLGSSDIYKNGHWLTRHGDRWMNPWIYGKKISSAKGGFSEKLPAENIEWWTYPLGN